MTVIAERMLIGVDIAVAAPDDAASAMEFASAEETWFWLACRNDIKTYCSECRFGFGEVYRYVSNQLFHAFTAVNRLIIAMDGTISGMIICMKMRNSFAPSIRADSTKLSGNPLI